MTMTDREKVQELHKAIAKRVDAICKEYLKPSGYNYEIGQYGLGQSVSVYKAASFSTELPYFTLRFEKDTVMIDASLFRQDVHDVQEMIKLLTLAHQIMEAWLA